MYNFYILKIFNIPPLTYHTVAFFKQLSSILTYLKRTLTEQKYIFQTIYSECSTLTDLICLSKDSVKPIFIWENLLIFYQIIQFTVIEERFRLVEPHMSDRILLCIWFVWIRSVVLNELFVLGTWNYTDWVGEPRSKIIQLFCFDEFNKSEDLLFQFKLAWLIDKLFIPNSI